MDISTADGHFDNAGHFDSGHFASGHFDSDGHFDSARQKMKFL
jgi:hypothetical protein